MNQNTTEYVVHLNPVWRSKSDFIIMAKVNDGPPHYEQLWTKKITDNSFELCCIPISIYNCALGDIVTTAKVNENEYLLREVIKKSGHYTFRVWFNGTDEKTTQNILRKLYEIGAHDMEFYSKSLLAIDASNRDLAIKIRDYLNDQEQCKSLEYENGEVNIDY